jgi:sugar-specific transcriptional regulator TrmB
LRIDLTPFGFTATENAVYGALLEGGPASGYGIAKRVGIARANAYQALNGLVKKKAATVVAENPQRFRATRPDAVLALVVNAASQSLDVLEEQVARSPVRSDPSLVPLNGTRTIADLAMRTAARAGGEVLCIAPQALLQALGPAWRRREADGRTTVLWAVDEGPGSVSGIVANTLLAQLLGSPLFLLITGEAAIAARITGEGASGFWATDPTLVGLARAAAFGLINQMTALPAFTNTVSEDLDSPA